MSLEPFLAVFVITQFRKNLKNDGLVEKWNKYLNIGYFIAIGIFFFDVSFSAHKVALVFAHLYFLGVVIAPYYIDELKSSKQLAFALIPYAVAGLISDILEKWFPTFYDNHENTIQSLVIFSLIWAFSLWMINRKQSKALENERRQRFAEQEQNRMMAAMKVNLESEVRERTAELTKQTEELQLALSELKSTQAQLIQSEKMASLGELTAGIAHEIQNPLNFVNNFSEVSIELLEELKEEILDKLPDDVKEEADDIISDITQNLSKINQHGKRADAIVKGMLQHSRATTGKKEPTDINALADEYLRLSYHGLRAKDKSFNAGMKTSFDPELGKIEAIPQDLGRVLLNLFNNSFYSVTEKKKSLAEGYEPTVTVNTQKIKSASGANMVQITVEDNGTGIPQKVLDKIYQPFFTTKPTGQGTGLGLSMSYDIITKGHGGELKVETAEGQFARFIITLPTGNVEAA
ncbi:sensor histidine kinase [Mucilaginibacter celer]|uniref:histidine kinase n=1 Tax=Mucilaginibacter celer TaxID=2305508 RepID=A0A494W739_9SPHI|nr:ATP-binding protein [Mucilaginibacter celer]AYL99335.1 histidine kinase [Mucilaginibacter celer]